MDERIKNEYRKIYSELTSIIMVFVAISLLVKVNLFHMGTRECATEFIILVFSPLYMVVRQYMMGLDPNGAVSKKKQKTAFLCAILSAVAAFSGTMYWSRGGFDRDAATGLVAFIAVFILVYFLSRKLGAYFSEKKAKKYED